MLRKFRRNSKPSPEDGLSALSLQSSKEESTDAGAQQPQGNDRLSFFSLPAEIRNDIYELIIADTTLSLPSHALTAAQKLKLRTRKRRVLVTPINGLLLASRQCRQEYLSTLFSRGAVTVEVKDFDFEGLIRVSSGLDEMEVRYLQSNRNLTVQLMTQNCRQKDGFALRKWLNYLRDCEARLPWKYEVPLEKLLPPTMMGRVRLMHELEYYADSISALEPEISESQKLELKQITDAFYKAVEWLEGEVGEVGRRRKDYSRSLAHLRGLPGGGVY